jgi:hypothetical protein
MIYAGGPLSALRISPAVTFAFASRLPATVVMRYRQRTGIPSGISPGDPLSKRCAAAIGVFASISAIRFLNYLVLSAIQLTVNGN